ncbi:MAG: MFS transporter [Bryobacteraceae bacterium]|nr:MFS transporter [Bryobacteraceae bacterium]
MRAPGSSAEAPAIEPPRIYPGWLVVAAAFCGVMVSFGSLLVFTFGIFLKPLSQEFGWGRESISAAFGIAAMTVAVCSPVLGRLLDRYGARRVVLFCMAVFGVAFGSLSLLTPSLLHLYATFFIIGAVGNGTTQMGYARAVSSWFTHQRGMALALVMAGVGAGSIVFPTLAQAIIDARGWRSAYLALGVIVLAMGIPLTALFVRENPGAGASRPTAAGSSVREGVASRAFWLLVATLFLGSIAVNGAITHLSPLLTDRGVNADRAALAVSVLGAASLAGRLVTGRLLDRYFGPKVSFVLLLGVAAGISLLAVASTGGQGLLAAALIGFGLGGEADVTPYLLTRYFGLRSFSTLYGLTWTAYAIAGAAGPVLMGRVYDAAGSYAGLLALLAVLTVISAALMLFLPRYPQPAGSWNVPPAAT